MSQQPSQDSQSQSDQESQNDNNTIETQSIYDGPYESCLNCPNETIVEGSCFCLMCYAELALCIEILDEEQNEDDARVTGQSGDLYTTPNSFHAGCMNVR